MKFPLFIYLLLFVFSSQATRAQTPFTTVNYIDINNIKAAALVHGDIWNNPVQNSVSCEYPKGSGKQIASAGSLWMAGYDANNTLHVSAQTYRQTGNDYWPGPLDTLGPIDYYTSQNWTKIWKINKSDLNAFLAINNHTSANTPTDILTWPAKGNIYAAGSTGPLTITRDMAPFIDVNNDGVYNALQGDYPSIHGDQALWWVYNDNGPTHDQTNGFPSLIEIRCMAYGYSRSTLIDNVVYYDYTITNRSALNYTNFRIGQFADFDLGWAYDDYIGFDSSHRMSYEYNGRDSDILYGKNIPILGMTMIVAPDDNSTYRSATGSFMYFDGDFSATGNPSNENEYNNYLRSTWRDDMHLKLTCSGRDTSSGSVNINYSYQGIPGDSTGLSECSCNNPVVDRRFVLATNDINFAAGETKHLVMALVATNLDTDHVCGNFNYNDIETVADTAWAVYFSQAPTSVLNIEKNSHLEIYPNPAHNSIHLKTIPGGNTQETISVVNMLGQMISLPSSKSQSEIILDINKLSPGVYNILYHKGDIHKTGTFVKL